MQLKNQVLHLGNKSKFKVGEDRYCAVNKDSKSSLTCVLCVDQNSQAYETGIPRMENYISFESSYNSLQISIFNVYWVTYPIVIR
jgi:hypothetical protein